MKLSAVHAGYSVGVKNTAASESIQAFQPTSSVMGSTLALKVPSQQTTSQWAQWLKTGYQTAIQFGCRMVAFV